MMRVTLILILVLSNTLSMIGQGSLVAEFTMDQCDLENDLSDLGGDIFGSQPCACGVQANGLQFDGGFNTGSLDNEIKDILSEDWTISFYVKFENDPDETVDLFFLGENCGRDSVFSVRYFSSSGRFRVRLSDSPGNEAQVDGPSNPNSCWQYVAIVKQGSTLTLYINGQLTEQNSAISNLRLNVGGRFTIADGPCLNVPSNPDSKFRGSLDELRIYNYPLTEQEINRADYRPDQILINDTTIFVGGSVLLLTGGTCSGDFSWSPGEGLSNPNILEPLATPEETTTYTLEIQDGSCRIQNDIKISVVSADELTCADLKLPSAFTPNSDRINDTYGISNAFLAQSIESFEIFNKWGSRVFFSNNTTDTWNGMYKNELAPSTSYVYLVQYTCEGQAFHKTGTLHLIR